MYIKRISIICIFNDDFYPYIYNELLFSPTKSLKFLQIRGGFETPTSHFIMGIPNYRVFINVGVEYLTPKKFTINSKCIEWNGISILRRQTLMLVASPLKTILDPSKNHP